MVAFRVGQAYSRFWEGCALLYGIHGDTFNAASTILSFTSLADSKKEEALTLRHLIARLFSLWNALILAELEGTKDSDGQAFTYPLLDVQGLDNQTLVFVDKTDAKVEYVFQKLQQSV